MANLILSLPDDREDLDRHRFDRQRVARWLATLAMAGLAVAVVVGTLEYGARTRSADRVEAATPEGAAKAATSDGATRAAAAESSPTLPAPAGPTSQAAVVARPDASPPVDAAEQGPVGQRPSDPAPVARPGSDPPLEGGPPAAEAPVGPADALWPLSIYARRYDDPVAVAQSFATEYIGFTKPLIGEFRSSGPNSGEVDMRPAQNGPVTVILVERLPADRSWWAVGAASDHLMVSEPVPSSTIIGPARYVGEAWAPSGQVEIRIIGQRVGRPLATTDFPTGGGEELDWFEGQIGRPTQGDVTGAMVFLSRHPQTGRVWEATVIPTLFISSEEH